MFISNFSAQLVNRHISKFNKNRVYNVKIEYKFIIVNNNEGLHMTWINISYFTDRLLWLHNLQIVSMCFEVGPTAATADHTLQVQFTNKPNHAGFTKWHFDGPDFHIVEFTKTLAHNIKIQYKFMYRQINCFRVLISSYTAGRACLLTHHRAFTRTTLWWSKFSPRGIC